MDSEKSVLRGRFIAIQSYFKKQEKHRLDSLTLHLKQLEKEEQNKTKQNPSQQKEGDHKNQSRNNFKKK